MKPVLFISHSSTDNERAKALVAAIEATGKLLTVLDVANLRIGEEFAPQIFQWTVRCQGAVLLLTKNVMERPAWILQEATVLRARSILEGKSFRLFLIVDPGVRDTDIWKQWFSPLRLDDVQLLNEAFPPEGSKTIADAIVAAMKDAENYRDDYFSLLELRIKDRLKPFMEEESTKLELSKNLHINDAQWLEIIGSANGVETMLARCLCLADFGNFQNIAGLFNALQERGSLEQRQRLLKLLRSYWVPLSNSARLADALAAMQQNNAPLRTSPPNIVLIETPLGYTGQYNIALMHSERQFDVYNRLGKWIPVSGGNESPEELYEAVREGLAAIYVNERSLSVETLKKRRANAFEKGQYTFIHVPVFAVADHVRSAALHFPHCLFVVTAPADKCQGIAASLDVDPICPIVVTPSQLEHLAWLDEAASMLKPSGDQNEVQSRLF